MGKRRQFAKLTAPTLPALVPRPRLFKLLDRARKQKIVWVTAIPGSGKTSLVASYLRAKRQRCLWIQLDEGDSDPATFFHYFRLAAEAASPRARTPLENLTPEYLPHLAVFARRFFAAVYQRLAPRTALVLDNYQTLHASSPVHELVRSAAAYLPRGATLFVISRSVPPPVFARMQAEQQLATINERVLRLTRAETALLLRLHAGKRDRRNLTAIAKGLHTATGGWVAGTVLLTQTGGAGDRLPSSATPEVLFDYFATEVLNDLDPVSRKVLLATALLPSMTAVMAQTLTGEPSAGRILAGLHRGGYFTQRHHEAPTRYQYHPLFQEFLLSRARTTVTAEELVDLHGRAAALLAADGQIEAAMALWTATRRFADAALLIQSQAPLLIGQGRANAVIQWIEAIPPIARDSAPWLWYWLGAAYLTVRPTGARALFERALHAFEASTDRLGALLAGAAVVEAIIYAWRDVPELDSWVDRLAKLAEDAGDALPPAVESVVACAVFYGLFWRRAGDARFAGWCARVERMIGSTTELDMRLASAGVALVNAYVNGGDVARAERLLRRVDEASSGGEISPFAQLAVFQMHAVVSYTLGEAEESLKAAARGLEFAAECGVAFWTVPLLGARCLAELHLGDVTAARRSVAQMLALSPEGVMVFRSWMLTMQSWVEHEHGNLRAAHRSAEAALQLTAHEGPFPEILARFSIAQTEHALGRPAEAAKHLARLAEIARDARSPMCEIGWRFMAAQFAFAAADAPTALAELRAATRVGVTHGYLAWQGRMCRDELAFVCAKALEAGIEPEYVRALVRSRQLLPAPDAAHVEAWPWPIKIYSLGRFSLLRDEQPVVFAGKTQKRPLDFLKVLIALGGRDVAQGRLAQWLWPQAEGDAATAAFTTTLKRLRALLGRADAITLSAGKLTINPRVCWVDAWAFERGLRLAGSDVEATEQALAAYRGPFLGAEEHSWSIPLRERLRARLLRGIRAVGNRLEGAERWADAVELYQRGLDADDVAEELYQRLIVCHDRLGQRGEALSAYRRCKKLLRANGGLAPSAKTEKLYEGLLAP